MDTNAFHITVGVLSCSLLSGIGIVIRLAYRRFKATGAQEVESFSRYASQGVKYYLGKFVRRQLAAQLTLRQYARHQLNTTAREMLVPATFPVRLKTDQVFVPLLLGGGTATSQINYEDLLDRAGERILILGEPGSGKSSLFKRLFRDACRRASSTPRHNPVPILFELRNLPKLSPLSSSEGRRLFDFLVSALIKSAVYRSSSVIEDLSHGAGYLILLDGLDEVSSAQSNAALNAISGLSAYLAEISPKSTLLVSSRTQYYFSMQRRDLAEIFELLTIRPFTLSDIYVFLTKWPFKVRAKENVTRIFARLRMLPSLTEMCTNPLALSMFVARDQQTGGAEMPETRSRFYDALMDELIIFRRARREDMPTATQRLREVRRNILGAVCLGHMLDSSESANSIPVGRFLNEIRKHRYGGADSAAAIEELANATGLFSWERKSETMRFLHLTICEFLAAAEVIQLGDPGWQDLLDALGDGQTASDQPGQDFWTARLSEVIAFTAGLAPRSLRERMLKDLAAKSVSETLLRAILEMQNYTEPVTVGTVDSECRRITAIHPENWDAEWFAKLRLLVAVLRDASASRQVDYLPTAAGLPDASHFLLRLIEKYNAEDKLLSTLAHQDADAAIGIAEQDPTRSLMFNVAGTADDFAVLQGILGRLERGVSGWRMALLERAMIDRNIARVLYTAVTDISERGGAHGAKSCWAESWLTRNSVYARLLDEVANVFEATESSSAQNLVEGIARLHPPKYDLILRLRAMLPRALSATVAFSGLFAFYIWLADDGKIMRVPLNVGSLVVLVVPLVMLAIPLAGSIKRRSMRKALLSEEVIGLKVTDSSVRIVLSNRLARSSHGVNIVTEGKIVSLRRDRVLRELLNLEDFRFSPLYGAHGRTDVTEMHVRLSAAIAGVRNAEIELLRLARNIRRKERSWARSFRRGGRG
jgi:hypothetical protein